MCFSKTFNTPSLKFEHYTSASGLAHGETQFIFKDSKGFIWIGTSDGLIRYDGYELKIFRNDPSDSTTIGSGWPKSMAEDKNGNLWIGTFKTQGLSMYNPVTGKFKQYNNPKYKNLLPADWIGSIFIDNKNQLWLSGNESGLYCFNPETDKTIIYKHDSLDASSINSDSPGNMFVADANHFYIAVSYGFDLFDIRSGKCKHYLTSSNKINNAENNYSKIFKDSKDNLWICTFEGLKMFNPLNEKFIEYRHVADNPSSISSDSTFDMCESPDGRLWITMLGGDLNVFDPSKKIFYHYSPQEKDLAPSNDVFPHNILYDPSGKIWIQENYSFETVNLVPDKFKIFSHDEKNKNSLCWNGIQYIYEDRHGKIFITTLYGVCVYNPLTDLFELFQPDPSINKLIDKDRVDIIFQDRDDNYWMEINQEKLIYYNPNTHHSKIFTYHEKHHPDSLGIATVYDIYQDRNGIIWFAGEFVLCRYDPIEKKFKSIPVSQDNKNPLANSVSQIIDINDGKLWLTSHGLYNYDYASDKIYNASFDRNDKNSWEWENGDLMCSAYENGSKVWIGSAQGLYLIDLKDGRSRKFTTLNGLPSNLIWGVVKDDHRNLWLHTNDGLCKFTPPDSLFNENKKPVIRIYNTSDGLPANEFGFNGTCQLKNGTILSCTMSNGGLIVFHPDSMKDNTFIPQIYITHFSINNNEVQFSDTNKFLKSPIEFTQEIILTYKENVFSFTFAGLSFVHPENNHYAYKLEGFDVNLWYKRVVFHTVRMKNY